MTDYKKKRQLYTQTQELPENWKEIKNQMILNLKYSKCEVCGRAYVQGVVLCVTDDLHIYCRDCKPKIAKEEAVQRYSQSQLEKRLGDSKYQPKMKIQNYIK